MERAMSADAGATESLAGLALRPETEADLAFLFRVYASTRAAEMALVDWSDHEKESFLRMQFNAQRTHYLDNYPDARFDVLEQQGQAIGRLYVHRTESETRVMDITLLPEHRGRGLGGALMRALLDEAAAAGRSVSIHVERYNPAIRLYERLGFQAKGEDGGVYRLMEWRAPRG